MKVPVVLFVSLSLAAACCCQPQPKPGSDPVGTDTTSVVPHPADSTFIVDTSMISGMWRSNFADPLTVPGDSVIASARFFLNGVYQTSFEPKMRAYSEDMRYEFYTDSHLRFVSESDGYSVSIPLDLEPEVDYTLAKYGQKFTSDKFSLRVTLERVTPYTPNEHYFKIYTGEWLDRYISSQTHMNQNGMAFMSQPVKDNQVMMDGYAVNIYSINARGLDMPYYKIALVRPIGQWSRFGFLLFKCKDLEVLEEFDTILRSFRIMSPFGTARNYLPPQEPRPDPDWNAETKAYYQKLLDQQELDFGVFSHSMVEANRDNYDWNCENLAATQTRLEAAFGHGYDIMPTYTHLSWYGTTFGFPLDMARRFAGGNGFDDKPVLQFTYQYTSNNNNVSPSNTAAVSTPMYDILRGKYDGVFRALADGIKEYGHPVLFRLNNEMNTDWTSYCGMMTLCDPDIFIATWKRLYDIFKERGVDNCIWIFNPIAVSCPYSNWGEDLAYYPGNDYVQILGLTAYESGNSLPLTSFRDHYTRLYNKSSALFGNLPWVISEFGCGAGGSASGEEKRNASEQAKWVTAMFDQFLDRPSNPYLQPIKGAVWFSANDYNASSQTVNYYNLSDDLTETLAAFRDGFDKMYPDE